jgi:putative colanic acid biosynthesis acetyltransferase WcaF
MNKMDLSRYREYKPHYFKRLIWYFVNRTIFCLLIGKPFRTTRNMLLRVFGAKIHSKSMIYSSCKVWAPWNLELGKYCCVGPNTQLYNKGHIIIKDNSIVSQGAFLNTASHDITKSHHPLITAPIIVEDQAWIAADAFIMMGVTVGQGAVVGARACVFKDVEPWTVVGGNPAKFIKKREITQ